MEISTSIKQCSKCNVEKSLDNFHRYKKAKDGLQSRCKQCVKKSDAKRYIDNPNTYIKWRYKNPERYKEILETHRTKISAVYGIFSGDLSLYVGQSVQINGRLSTHKTCLKNQSTAEKNYPTMAHLYPLLRQHSNVEFRIVEECSPEMLLHREQYYIDTLKPLYNTYK